MKKRNSSVRPGYFPKESNWQKIKRFINTIHYRLLLKKRELFDIYQIPNKVKYLLILVVDTLFTGLLIWYVINYRNPLSYGLIAGLSLYFLKEIVMIIKTPFPKNKEE